MNYTIKGFRSREKDWIRKFIVQKGEENVQNDPVFKGPEITVRERAGPLNYRPVPLMIKGAA
jgi:hypothetical protein